VEIHDSARKHGVADEDIHHAIDHALASTLITALPVMRGQVEADVAASVSFSAGEHLTACRVTAVEEHPEVAVLGRASQPERLRSRPTQTPPPPPGHKEDAVFYAKVAFVLRQRLGVLRPGREWISTKLTCPPFGAPPIPIR
jgi:hypothetical protein